MPSHGSRRVPVHAAAAPVRPAGIGARRRHRLVTGSNAKPVRAGVPALVSPPATSISRRALGGCERRPGQRASRVARQVVRGAVRRRLGAATPAPADQLTIRPDDEAARYGRLRRQAPPAVGSRIGARYASSGHSRRPRRSTTAVAAGCGRRPASAAPSRRSAGWWSERWGTGQTLPGSGRRDARNGERCHQRNRHEPDKTEHRASIPAR